MDSEKGKNHYPKLGLLLLFVFQIVILFMYGFFGSYSVVVYTTRLQYILTNALAVLGFGLLLVYFKFSIKQTLIVALIVCSVNVQLGPLLQQFWYNVFIAGFNKGYVVQSDTLFTLMLDTATTNVNNFSLGFVRISTFCSISLLIALSSVIGKIGLVNTFLTSILFNIGWNLSYYLNYLIYFNQGPVSATYYIMDDFQGSRVFMFGAGFGLALLIIYNKFNPVVRNQNVYYSDTFASVFTLIGTSFIVSLLYYVLDTYTPQAKTQALMNIFFSFSGSIVSSIAIACILGGVVTLHQINMSIISGAIQISIIGGFIQTPYVSLVVGAFAGIVTGFTSYFVQNKINGSKIIDSKGIIAVYLINCILCAYFVCPIIIKAYKNVNPNLDYNEGFYMIYMAISFGIGLFSGFIAGIFRSCIKQDINLSDLDFFRPSYMEHTLPRPPLPVKRIVEQAPTNEKLTIHQSHYPSKIPQETGLFINI